MAPTGTLIVILATPFSGAGFLRSVLAGAGVQDFGDVFDPALSGNEPHGFGSFLSAAIRKEKNWQFDTNTAHRTITDYLSTLEKRAKGRPALIVVKDHQLRIADWPPTNPARTPRLLSLLLDRNYPIVRLTRRDLLAVHVQQLLADRALRPAGAGARKGKPATAPALTLDVQKTARQIRETLVSTVMIQRWVSTWKNVVHLRYEQLSNEGRIGEPARKAIMKVTDLEIAPETAGQAEPVLSLSDQVSNIDAVLDSFRGGNLAFLHELHRRATSQRRMAARANGGAKVPFILTNFKRPQNLPRLIDICLKSKHGGKIIVIDNAPDDTLRSSLDLSSGRVDYRPNFANLGAGHRFTVASGLTQPIVVAIDDDLFPTVEQIDTLIERARADPGRLHGIWGERLTQKDGHPHFANAVYGQDRDIDIINRVYVFDPAQASKADLLRQRLGFADWVKAIPSDDVLLSFASDRKPRMHDLGPIEDCPTSGAEGIAQWRHEDFIQRRWQVVAKLSRIRPARKVPFL